MSFHPAPCLEGTSDGRRGFGILSACHEAVFHHIKTNSLLPLFKCMVFQLFSGWL